LGTETAVTIPAPNGTFTFPCVPAGDYTLEARAPASLSGAVNFTDGSSQLSAGLAGVDAAAIGREAMSGSVPVSVVDHEVTDIALTLQRSSTIQGHVQFRGAGTPPNADQLSRIPVVAESASGASVGAPPGRVGADGHFTINNLLPGRYFVRAGSSPPGWSFASATSNGQDASDVVLELGPGDTIDDLVITFTNRPTTLTGTVRDARGGPVSSATVIIFPADRAYLGEYGLNPRRLRNTRVPENGVFGVTGLPAGQYLLVAIDEADANNWQDPARLDAWRTVATRVTLSEAETKVQDLRMAVKRQP
jgi:hypothetical protein